MTCSNCSTKFCLEHNVIYDNKTDHFGEEMSKCSIGFLSVTGINDVDLAERWIRLQCQDARISLRFKIMWRGGQGLIDRHLIKKQKEIKNQTKEMKNMQVSENFLSLFSHPDFGSLIGSFLGLDLRWESRSGIPEHHYLEEKFKMPPLEDMTIVVEDDDDTENEMSILGSDTEDEMPPVEIEDFPEDYFDDVIVGYIGSEMDVDPQRNYRSNRYTDGPGLIQM